MEDWLDDDGYPTEMALERISKWDFKDAQGCFEFMKSLWAYDNYWKEEDVTSDDYIGMQYDQPRHRYYISTAGWSGNESMIYALKENSLLWSLNWVQSRRGGHYIFELKEFTE